MTAEKPLILCVDDDPDILSYLRLVLEGEGLRFAGAASAEEGLRVYEQVEPDLVILDLMMEEVDAGTRFVKELERRRNEAPIFLLSSVGDDLALTADYDDLGLAGVFQKPIDRERFLGVVHAALSHSPTGGESARE